MKKFVAFIGIFVFSIGFSLAQSELLQSQIDLDKKEAAKQGYTLLDEGSAETNYDWVSTFDQSKYYSGNLYLIVIYLEGCSSCDIGMYFYDTNSGEIDRLSPQIKRSGQVVQAVHHVKQSITVKGELSAYAKSEGKVFTYVMLFRKSSY